MFTEKQTIVLIFYTNGPSIKRQPDNIIKTGKIVFAISRSYEIRTLVTSINRCDGRLCYANSVAVMAAIKLFR